MIEMPPRLMGRSFTRLTVLWLVYAFLLSLIFLFINSCYTFSPIEYVPLKQHPHSTIKLLRPGDFVDRTRQRAVPEFGGDASALYDPQGVGSRHDFRNPRFYQGGLKSLTTQNEDDERIPISTVYDPYPAYNSVRWQQAWKGKFRPCLGPAGMELDRTSPNDAMSVFMGNQKGQSI
jgi:hypothetical protein